MSVRDLYSASKMHVTVADVRTTPALLLLLMWQWLLLIIPPCSNEPLVLMMGAKVKGLETTVSNRTVWKFLGIRYAKSTAGLERFQRPLPADLLAEIDGTRFGARCPTSPFDSGMSEDCLFLNVYTPKEARKLPVLVFIHGGGFVSGSSNDIDGEVLAAEGDIIVVTFNYRLGVLGFMCTGDNSSRGNYGLWDQRMALKWVETYIQYFGGDEKSVTLAGMSAGAASAAILSLSPVSRNLFRSVIQMSGSASSPWARVSPAMALETTRVCYFVVCPCLIFHFLSFFLFTPLSFIHTHTRTLASTSFTWKCMHLVLCRKYLLLYYSCSFFVFF